MNENWQKLCAMASAEVDAILAAFPRALRDRAVKVAVIYEPVPRGGLQAEGIEADTLGLFTGADFVEEGHVMMPPQIILFLENLWDYAEGDEKCFREEIRRTFLHELGHYLGLDEDELADRHLE